MSFSNGYQEQQNQSLCFSPRKIDEKPLLKELDTPSSYEELSFVISKLSSENPSNDTLFKGKYQISILENLLPYQKPIGEIFQKAVTIFGAKPKRMSNTEMGEEEVFVDDSGGCPLPLQFDSLMEITSVQNRTHSLVKELNEKYVLYPLSQNVGRKLLSLCNRVKTEKKHSFVVMCYGENPKSVLLLGSSLDCKSARLIMEVKGSVTKQKQLPRLSSLKEEHLRGFPLNTTVDTSVFSHYDFLEYTCDDAGTLKPVRNVSLTVECQWSKTSALLEPLTDDCTCITKLKAVSGDSESGAFTMYQELQFIEALEHGFHTGMMAWNRSKTDSNVLARIKDFMNDERPCISIKGNPFSTVTGLELLDKTVLSNRTNLDFTEKLWYILKDCFSLNELIEALGLVFSYLEDFNAPPFVHNKNSSSIALFIKKMMEGPIVSPDLDSKQAIRILLEMGIEKLRRDYINIFLNLDLVSYETISYFLKPGLQSPEAVACLKKLHSVLELTIVCVKCLGLSQMLLSKFVRNTLKYYSNVPNIDLSHIFTFQIPVVKARQLLHPMRPTKWELSLTSSNRGYLKQTVHRYTTTSVHDHIYAPKNYHPKLMLPTANYVYSTAILIQDDLL